MNLDTLLRAVATHLNTTALPAAVSYDPNAELATLEAARIVVSPAYQEGEGPLSETPIARNVTTSTGRVSVALVAPAGEEESEVPNLLETLTTLRTTLRGARLAGYPTARWRSQELIAAPSPEHFKAQGVFLGLFHVQYTTNHA